MAVLFERSNRRWTSNQTLKNIRRFPQTSQTSGCGEEAFRNESAMDLDEQSVQMVVTNFIWDTTVLDDLVDFGHSHRQRFPVDFCSLKSLSLS